MNVINIYAPAEAQRGILRRRRWEDQEMPSQVLDGIERIFGERIAPAEAVERILRDIRARGDAAVHEWSARVEGRRDGGQPGGPPGGRPGGRPAGESCLLYTSPSPRD